MHSAHEFHETKTSARLCKAIAKSGGQQNEAAVAPTGNKPSRLFNLRSQHARPHASALQSESYMTWMLTDDKPKRSRIALADRVAPHELVRHMPARLVCDRVVVPVPIGLLLVESPPRACMRLFVSRLACRVLCLIITLLQMVAPLAPLLGGYALSHSYMMQLQHQKLIAGVQQVGDNRVPPSAIPAARLRPFVSAQHAGPQCSKAVQ